MSTKSRNLKKRQRFTKAVGDPRDARGLFAAMRRFLEYRSILGATESSLYNLERYLRDFIGWADERAVTHPEHVTLAVLQRYQRWIYYYRKKDGAPLSILSQRGKIIPLRVFFKWLTRTGQIPANPAAELDLPRSIRKLPRHVLTEADVEKVMVLADVQSPIGLRDRAMMEILYATGMRRMEIAQLEVTDIDYDRCMVLIREGKGRKDRLIPMGERALYWVQAYLDKGRPQLMWNQQDMTLFLSRDGYALSQSWLSTAVAAYVKKANIGKQGGCHLFRHTMATLMLEGGADIRFIQAMLGHADIASTQIYTQVAIKQLQLVHSQTHPGANRRARGTLRQVGEGNSQSTAENISEALLAALEAEAAEEDADADADCATMGDEDE